MKKTQGPKACATGSNAIIVDYPRYQYIPKARSTIDDNRITTTDSPTQSTTDASIVDYAPSLSEEGNIPSLISDHSDDGSEPEITVEDPANDQDPRLSVSVSEEPGPMMQDDLDYQDGIQIDPHDGHPQMDHDDLDLEDEDYRYLYAPSSKGTRIKSFIPEFINGCDLRLAAVNIDGLSMPISGLQDDSTVPSKDEEILKIVPCEYHDFVEVFRKKEGADILPPHRPYDHRIILKEGARLKVAPIYQLDSERIKFLRKYVENQRQSGKIRPSSSPFGSPCFLAVIRD